MSVSANYHNSDINIFRVEKDKICVNENVKKNLSSYLEALYHSIETYIELNNNVVDFSFGEVIEGVENFEKALKFYGLLV